MDIKKFISEFEEISALIHKAAKTIQEKYSPTYTDEMEVQIEEDYLILKFISTSSCGCCSDDYNLEEVPIDIITAKGMADYMEKRDKDIREFTEQIKRRDEETERKKVEQEKKQLKKLQDKYPCD